MTGNGMASLHMAMAWQIIEGYAQLRRSMAKNRPASQRQRIAMQRTEIEKGVE